MRILLLGIFILMLAPLSGQERGRVLLTDYIHELEKKYGVVFSYDAGALQDIRVPVIEATGLTAVLAGLDSVSAFNFRETDRENVLIIKKIGQRNLQINGRVLSSDGYPLPGAVVGVKKQNAYTITDDAGRFKLLVMYNGADSASVSFVGFGTQQIALRDFNQKGTLKLELNESGIELGGVVISGYMTSGINYVENKQSITVKPENLGLLPAETETDLFSALQAMPGINAPDDKAGNLTLRGSDPDKILISFDNIPIYHKGHYFGGFSPFNTQVIDEITVQRNGIASSDKGGRVSGYIGMRTKDRIPDKGDYAAGLATSYLYADALAPVVKKKLAVLAGVRSSYPFNFQSPRIQSLNTFIFQESELGSALRNVPYSKLLSYSYSFADFNIKTIYEINERHKATISYLNIVDNMSADVDDTRFKSISYNAARLNNWGINFSMQDRWTSRISTVTDVTKSFYSQKMDGSDRDSTGTYSQEAYKNTIDNLKIRSGTTFAMKRMQSLLLGYEADLISLASTHNYFDRNTPYTALGRGDRQTIHALFANYDLSGTDKLINISAGIRLNYFTGTQRFYPEPRVLLNFLVNKNLTLKSSAGMYNQFITNVTGTHMSTMGAVDNPNWNLTNNTDIPVVSGNQLMAGWIYTKKDLVFDVEGYVKHVDHVTAYNFISVTNDSHFVHGGYTAYGVDVLLKKTVKRFEGWISYSYSNCTARFETLEFEYIWNQPHVLKAVLGYNYRNFKFSAGWRYRSGLAALPGIRNRYLAGPLIVPGAVSSPPSGPQQPRVFVDGSVARYTDRFPSSHQLDISVSYRIVPKKKKFTFHAGATVQNVYNNRAVISQTDRPLSTPNTFLRVNKYSLGFMPSLILGVNW